MSTDHANLAYTGNLYVVFLSFFSVVILTRPHQFICYELSIFNICHEKRKSFLFYIDQDISHDYFKKLYMDTGCDQRRKKGQKYFCSIRLFGIFKNQKAECKNI